MSAGRPQPDPGLTVGLQATVTAEVGEDDTAIALGSGDLPVLGTPRLLALAAAAPQLPAGTTTVGAAVSLEHRKPSPLGTPIEVRAELVEVTGRKLFFGFIAYGPGTDDEAVIGAGTVQRVLVDAEQFLRRAGAGPAGAA